MLHVVKRAGKLEKFDERKVYASCYSACLSTHMDKKEAEKICSKITNEIKKWIKPKKTVTSDQIFKQQIKLLKKHDKDAAFMFETHRDVA